MATTTTQRIVDIADLAVSNNPTETLITYSLGSCIGVSVWDPVAKVGGLLHFMLPLSKIDKAKAERNPCMFADTGIPKLFEEAYKLGAQKKRMYVKLAGGANILDAAGAFGIGKRNHLVARKIFWKNNILVDAEDVGGNSGRTMRIDIGTGRVTLTGKKGEETEL